MIAVQVREVTRTLLYADSQPKMFNFKFIFLFIYLYISPSSVIIQAYVTTQVKTSTYYMNNTT